MKKYLISKVYSTYDLTSMFLRTSVIYVHCTLMYIFINDKFIYR